jgi:hypothetical protein
MFESLIFDNNMYATVGERLSAAKSAVRSTSFGRGGVIKVVLDGQKVKFQVPIIGKSFESLNEAIGEAASTHVSQIFEFQMAPDLIRAGSKVNTPASIYESIYNKVQNLNSRDRQLFESAGISIPELKDLKLDILMMGKSQGGMATLVESIEKMRENGLINGISILSDDGARVLQFRTGKQTLNKYQANLLLATAGHDQLSPGVFGEILRTGDSKKLIDKLAKVGKRERGFISDRDISLAGSELKKFMGGQKSLRQSALILDPQYELLMKYAGKFDMLDNDLRAVYKNLDPSSFFGRIIDDADPKLVQELKATISTFDSTGVAAGEWKSNALAKHLKNNFARGDAGRQLLVDNIFQSIEYGYDGSDLLNEKNLKKYVGTLRKELKKLKNLNTDEAKIRMSEISSQIKNIENNSLYQITGRGNIPGVGNIKTAFQVAGFDNALDRYSMIVSKFGLKGESNLAGGVESLLLSGIGDTRERVFVDEVMAAFHPKLFGDDQTLAMIGQRARETVSEFEAIIESNELPNKILKQLKRTSEMDIDLVPSEMRYSAMRNRQYAQKVLELYQSGVKPNQAPEMLNALSSLLATEAYREKGGFIQAVMPDAYRFALDTEAILGGQKNGIPSLGTGFEKLAGIMHEGNVIDIDKDILKFRVKDHKLLFSAQAIGEFRHSLGGFDLDDKGVPRVRTYVDNQGKKRLGYYLFRQPSGPEEFMFIRPDLDYETIQSLFDNSYFRKSLNQGLLSGNLDPKQRRNFEMIQGILDGKAIGPGFLKSDDLEATLVDIYEKSNRNIASLTRGEIDFIRKHGSSSLQITPELSRTLGLNYEKIIPRYSNPLAIKAVLDSGAFDLSKQIMKAVETHGVTGALVDQLSKASNFEEMMAILGKGYEADPTRRAILTTAYEIAVESKTKQTGGILGVFVNRSMFAGNILSQYEDILAGITDNRMKKYMTENQKLLLIAQEQGIDLSVDFSGVKEFNIELINRINNSLNVDEEKLAKFLGKSAKDVTLDSLGEGMIEGIGKVIGFARATGSDIGIDKLMLEGKRLGKLDSEVLIRGITQGLNDAVAQNFAISPEDVIKEAETLSQLLVKKDPQKLREALINGYSLDASNQAAALTRLNKAGATAKMMFETALKKAKNYIGINEAVLSAETNRESIAAAQTILKRNESLFNQLIELNRGGIKDLTETEKAARNVLQNYLGTKIYSEMNEAVKIQNVSMEYLVNAIDQLTFGTKKDIRSLAFPLDTDVSDSLLEMRENFNKLTRLRNAKYYEKFNDDTAKSILDILGAEDAVTKANVKEKAEVALRELIEGGQSDNLEGAIYRKLLGTEIADDLSASLIEIDPVTAAEAENQVRIINEVFLNDQLGADELDNLRALGSISDDIVPQDAADIIPEILKSLGEDDSTAVKKVPYERLSISKLKEMFDNKLFRRGTIAVGALALGSLTYSAIRDRTTDDITGPPLLPGGNPYEKNVPFRLPEIGTFDSFGYSMGNSYKVSLSGDQGQIEKFNNAARGLVNGNMNTTIYNGIPKISNDPYASMGQSF